MIGGWTDNLTELQLHLLGWIISCQCEKHYDCGNEPSYIWDTWFKSTLFTCGEDEL